MRKEMAGDAGSPDIGESNATPQVEVPQPAKTGEYHRPKLSRGNAIRMGVLAGVATILAACGVNIGKTPNSSVSPTPFKETPTQPYTPTESPTAPATATETKVPTETATATEAVMQLNTDPENIEAYSKVTMEDITSGRFEKANRAIAQPFSQASIDDFPNANWFVHGWLPQYPGIEKSILIANAPILRWISFNSIEIDKKERTLFGLQILNKDGTYSILAVIVDPRSPQELIKSSESWKIKNIKISNGADFVIKYATTNCSVLKYGTGGACGLDYSQQTKLMEEWIKTKIVPEELEKLPLGGIPRY